MASLYGGQVLFTPQDVWNVAVALGPETCLYKKLEGGGDFLDGLYLTARHIIGEIISIKMLQNATASQTCSRDLAQWIKLATVTPSQHPAVTQMHHTPNYKHVIKKMHLIKRGD